MSEPNIIVNHKGWECKKCHHKWIPRLKSEKPHTCPKCKSVRWDDQERKK